MNIDPFVIVNISLWKLCTIQSVRYWKSTENCLFFFFLIMQLLQKALVKIAAFFRCTFQTLLYEGTLGPKSCQKTP